MASSGGQGASWGPGGGSGQAQRGSQGDGFGDGRQGNGGRGGAGYAGRGPKDYQRSDDRIREELCDLMTDDDELDASEITVQVQKGEVTLTGTVSSRDQKRRAEDLVESISGSREVINNIRVSRQDGGDRQGTQGRDRSSQGDQTQAGSKSSKQSGTAASS